MLPAEVVTFLSNFTRAFSCSYKKGKKLNDGERGDKTISANLKVSVFKVGHSNCMIQGLHVIPPHKNTFLQKLLIWYLNCQGCGLWIYSSQTAASKRWAVAVVPLCVLCQCPSNKKGKGCFQQSPSGITGMLREFSNWLRWKILDWWTNFKNSAEVEKCGLSWWRDHTGTTLGVCRTISGGNGLKSYS